MIPQTRTKRKTLKSGVRKAISGNAIFEALSEKISKPLTQDRDDPGSWQLMEEPKATNMAVLSIQV